MKGKKLAVAAVVTFFFLVVLNATLFPLLFPDGRPERLQNMRPSPRLPDRFR